ncbi:MAG: hypothetical protein J6W82_03340 [Bacteroidales bacterium]|jgi:hypothetical protein|nr:hypothetical protein [Bacteroidales bacterium]
MKGVFISYNQAYNDEVIEVLESVKQRGYTRWTDIQGKGSFNGIPHLGSHAWPEQNHAVLAFVKDDKVRPILDALRAKDEASPDLGLRAFVWNIEESY